MPYQESFIRETMTMVIFIGIGVWCIYLIASAIRRKQQNDMQRHLLDKFSSAKDFSEFVQSPAGQKYVMSFSDAITSPRNAVLSSLRTGIVLVFLGFGFFGIDTGDRRLWWIPGFLVLFLGLGFIVSGVVARLISKKSGDSQPE
jgi:uncharacterized ion transporter superfamily protein YfcC